MPNWMQCITENSVLVFAGRVEFFEVKIKAAQLEERKYLQSPFDRSSGIICQ